VHHQSASVEVHQVVRLVVRLVGNEIIVNLSICHVRAFVRLPSLNVFYASLQYSCVMWPMLC